MESWIIAIRDIGSTAMALVFIAVLVMALMLGET